MRSNQYGVQAFLNLEGSIIDFPYFSFQYFLSVSESLLASQPSISATAKAAEAAARVVCTLPIA